MCILAAMIFCFVVKLVEGDFFSGIVVEPPSVWENQVTEKPDTEGFFDGFEPDLPGMFDTSSEQTSSPSTIDLSWVSLEEPLTTTTVPPLPKIEGGNEMEQQHESAEDYSAILVALLIVVSLILVVVVAQLLVLIKLLTRSPKKEASQDLEEGCKAGETSGGKAAAAVTAQAVMGS
ncbi:hypothetical protein FOL47_003311 [Perkinsus chesapeaki]|uniref:Uncharacterized protein n=1 Tax=Perkinsus chesapeaki TaxID=330153 RepID=A0A7J6MZT8_PERCH|nr:hypothetical protein FOL47_003311 [Perkinsus chesapeaki]